MKTEFIKRLNAKGHKGTIAFEHDKGDGSAGEILIKIITDATQVREGVGGGACGCYAAHKGSLPLPSF